MCFFNDKLFFAHLIRFKMKQYILLLCKTAILLLFFCALSFQSKAGHLDGAEITYKCTNIPGIFEVTLIVYRECSGIPLCAGGCGSACSQAIAVMGVDSIYSNSTYGSVTLNLESVRDINQNTNCPSGKNACTNMGCVTAGTYTPALERYVFKGFANIGSTSSIPTNCCNVRFAWSQGARNSNIETGAATQNFYIDAIINRCLAISPCNSSPEFSKDPNNIICGGESYVFNNGAIDPDYDSLSYAFAPSYQAFGLSVTYNPPFSYNRPMPWTGNDDGIFPAGIRCDSETGDIMFTPGNATNQNFIGLMAIAVKQWKTINGVPTVIGITRRDMQTTVLAYCPPNNPPRLITSPPLGTNPNAPKYKWDFCTGVQTCFSITANDQDNVSPTIDSTYLSWNKALENLGATFTPAYNPDNRKRTDSLGGPREDSYQFCWTPANHLASSNPYFFTVSVKDSRCPNEGKLTRSFSIRVLAKPNLSLQQSTSGCGNFQLSYTNNIPTQVPQSVVWKIATEPEDWSLSQNPSVFSSLSTVNVNRYKPGKYLVKLEANTLNTMSGGGCASIYYDTISIQQPQLKATVNNTFLCGGGTVQLTATSQYGSQPYTYRWFNNIADTDKVALNAPDFTNPTIAVSPGATRYYTIQVKDINNCKSYDSASVIVKPILSVEHNSLGCGNYSVNYFNHTSSQTPQMVKWTIASEPEDWSLSLNPSVIASQPSVEINRYKPGKYLVKLETDSVNNGTTCAIAFYDTITILTPQIKAIVRDTFSCGSNPIQLTAAAQYGLPTYTYRWFNSISDTNGTPLNGIPYTNPNITVTPQATRYYTVEARDLNNCKAYDSLKVLVTPVLNNTVIEPVSCAGFSDGKITIIMKDSLMLFQYKINNGNNQSSNIFTNLSANTYVVEVQDSLNCKMVIPNLVVSSPPSINVGTIVGSAAVFQNTSNNYSVTHQSALSYKWFTKKGTVVNDDSSTTTITWNVLGKDTVFVIGYPANQQCADTSMLVVSIGSVGISEMAAQMEVEIYPNPTQNNITLSVKRLPDQQSIELYDMQGKLILEQPLKQIQIINLESFTKGVYMLKVGNWRGKIIKN